MALSFGPSVFDYNTSSGPNLSFVSVLGCEARHLGKHHRSSFPRCV